MSSDQSQQGKILDLQTTARVTGRIGISRQALLFVDGDSTKVALQQQRDRLQKEELTTFIRLQVLQEQIEGYRSSEQTAAILVSIPDIIMESSSSCNKQKGKIEIYSN